jgi:membrane-associated protein
MTEADQILALIQSHGLIVLTILSVLEGPVVTVIAAWLASTGVLSLSGVFLCVVLGDLIGDVLLYLVGRYGPGFLPQRLVRRIGLHPRRVAPLLRSFRDNGPRLLVIGKLTHAAGFAVLIAAGVARIPVATFLAVNLLATVPKCMVLVALGFLAGSAFAAIGQWLFIGSVLVVALIVAGYLMRKRALGMVP